MIPNKSCRKGRAAVLAAAALGVVLAGCLQEIKSPEKHYLYDIRLDSGAQSGVQAFGARAPGGGDYIPPCPLVVTVRNTGSEATEDLFIALESENAWAFEVSAGSLPSIGAGESASFTVTFPPFDPGSEPLEAALLVGNERAARKIALSLSTYQTLNIGDEIVLSDDGIAAGAAGHSSAALSTAAPEYNGTMAWFSSNPEVATVDEDGTLHALGEGDTFIGFVYQEEDPELDQALIVYGKKLSLAAVEQIPPRLESVHIDSAALAKIRVVFSEPVSVSPSLFKVTVTTLPVGTPPTTNNDTAKTPQRAISGATPINNAPDGLSDTWDFVMEAPAGYGEILRLISTEAGAAKDAAQNALPQVDGIILNNPVKRAKAPCESAAGFYIDGVSTGSFSGATVYSSALAYLSAGGQYPTANHTYTIVIGQNQTYSAGSIFNSTQVPGSIYTNGGATLVITTPTGNTSDFTITVTGNGCAIVTRNGLTVIVDEHVIFDHGGADNDNNLVQVNDGGRLIIDGGVIKGNVSKQTKEMAGGVRMGGGTNGAIVILNSGKITENWVDNSATETADNWGGSGGVALYQQGIFVMHGGEISNNKLRIGTSAYPKGAAFSVRANSYVNQSCFYMTGGEIFGNYVYGADVLASAGAVYTHGEFQKTGGIIYGTRNVPAGKGNASEFEGQVCNGAITVGTTTDTNPGHSSVFERDSTADAGTALFVYDKGYPAWAPRSAWDYYRN
ncbi:MAG: hypothetical protein LBR16_06595 [Treponema sp.]|jgi:hypothetical protein|nr:hypothetical protein [Treponema sp.]